MSWSTPRRATSWRWVFKSKIRFLESELTVRLLTWEETAALTAKAFVTRAEGTKHRCDEEDSAMKFSESLSCHPSPQLPVAWSHAECRPAKIMKDLPLIPLGELWSGWWDRTSWIAWARLHPDFFASIRNKTAGEIHLRNSLIRWTVKVLSMPRQF